MHFREHEAPVSLPLDKPYTVRAIGDHYEIAAEGKIPPLRFRLYGPQAGFVLEGGRFKTIFYRVEQSRGYECRGPLWSPGFFRTTLRNGETFTVVASTEPWEKILALEGRNGDLRRIVFANVARLARRALFFNTGWRPGSELPARLGCKSTSTGAVR